MASFTSPVVRRYVAALLGSVGKTSAARTALAAAVDQFAQMISGSSDLQYLLASPVIPVGDQGRAVAAILARGGFDAAFSGFVRVVIQNGRASSLAEILGAARAEIDKQAGILDVYVDVAVPMTGQQEKKLIETVSRATGATVRLKTRVANDVIAGMRVRYNDVMIDDTVSGKLSKLTKALAVRTVF